MVTVHSSSQSLPKVKTIGQMQIKGSIGQFKGSTIRWQGHISHIKAPYWSSQAKRPRECEGSTLECWILHLTYSERKHKSITWIAKLAIRVNPKTCQTAKNHSPMIGRMDGKDLEERLTTFGS
ncbi:hypothetical protein Tco_1108299 [Tanacetum coccineum]